MFKLTSRAVLAVLLLLLATNGLVIFFPRDASAACAFDFTVRIHYYSEPELINKIGECYHPCWSPTVCSGSTSEYYAATGGGSCPPICQ